MPDLKIRLQHGGAYQADIQNIRRAVRANGTRSKHQKICIVHKSAPNCDVYFYVNMAYQPNESFPSVSDSLYTIAFSNNSNLVFSFKTRVRLNVQIAPTDLIQLTEDGSYGSLDRAQGPFPDIKEENLENAVRRVSAHRGPHLDKSVKESLVRLIIAVNEAVRFEDVEKGISLALARNTSVYAPPSGLIHAWGAHILPG